MRTIINETKSEESEALLDAYQQQKTWGRHAEHRGEDNGKKGSGAASKRVASSNRRRNMKKREKNSIYINRLAIVKHKS